MSTENIAYTCLTKQHDMKLEQLDYFPWINSDLSVEFLSLNQFDTKSNLIGNVLKMAGITKGDVVSIFLPRSPILISSFFGILKLEAISCVLFSTLGEEALFDRLENSQSKIIITKKSLVKKLQPLQSKLPELKSILVVDSEEDLDSNILSLPNLLKAASPELSYNKYVDPETPAFLQFTSGSTGKPKGALHVHGAIENMLSSFEEIMMPDNDDVYWCTADPAWITGLVYGIIVPFALQQKHIHFGGGFKSDTWMKLLEEQGVTVWYTAPTALRMLMQEEDSFFRNYDLSKLRRIYSVGEPLNPEIFEWGKRIFNKEIHDTWFQSETASMMIANRPGLKIKPGSMGIPRKGVEAFILNDHMQEMPAGDQGLLCLKKGWGSMFRNYYRKESAYQEKFNGDYYITGDLAKKDSDGYFWYISRADDVINTAGHLVGPFEVESALLEIEEVVDVAVVGADDPMLHQKIVAFIKIRDDSEWSRNLELKCRIYVSNKVSTTAIPAEFIIVDKIPKNQSGKILRRVLKAQYEGKDPGDLSTME